MFLFSTCASENLDYFPNTKMFILPLVITIVRPKMINRTKQFFHMYQAAPEGRPGGVVFSMLPSSGQ